ncbi:MAG: AMP-binding protein [bacterium]|nr:AMP-binding protein [bacterium]
MTVPDWLHAQARVRGDHAALVLADGTRVDYAALERRAAGLAHHLRALGAAPGVLVVRSLRNGGGVGHRGPRLRARALLVLCDPRWTDAEMAQRLRDVGARVLVALGLSATPAAWRA